MNGQVRVYLIVSGRGDCRLTKRRPTLDWDEVAFPINVAIPQGWGVVYDTAVVNITLPPAPDVQPPQVGEPELPEDGALEGDPASQSPRAQVAC